VFIGNYVKGQRCNSRNQYSLVSDTVYKFVCHLLISPLWHLTRLCSARTNAESIRPKSSKVKTTKSIANVFFTISDGLRFWEALDCRVMGPYPTSIPSHPTPLEVGQSPWKQFKNFTYAGSLSFTVTINDAIKDISANWSCVHRPSSVSYIQTL